MKSNRVRRKRRLALVPRTDGRRVEEPTDGPTQRPIEIGEDTYRVTSWKRHIQTLFIATKKVTCLKTGWGAYAEVNYASLLRL